MSCESLQFQIELYAEGELYDGAAIARVALHLASCRPCAEYLREHDELTARLLAGDTMLGDSKRRLERVSIAVAALPPRARSVRGPRLVLDVPAPPVPLERPRRWPWLFGAAAAMLLVGVALGMFLARDRRTSELARGESLLRLLNARSAMAEESQGRNRRWVLDERFVAELAAGRHSEQLLRLYGLDLYPGDAPEADGDGVETGQAGFVVDAAPRFGDRVTRSARFYLVADDAERAPVEVIEIDPRSWFQTRDLGTVRWQARQGKTKLYRVVALPASRHLFDLGLPPHLEPEPLPGAGSWGSSRRVPVKDWVVPATW